VSDRGRGRWFPASYFDLSGAAVATLTAWAFIDPVRQALIGTGEEYDEARDESYNCVDVTLRMTDGSTRWLTFMTTTYVRKLLERRKRHAEQSDGVTEPPAIWSSHIVIIHDLHTDTVAWTLREMDEQGELESHSVRVGEDDVQSEFTATSLSNKT
jgi:hypothetical protein